MKTSLILLTRNELPCLKIVFPTLPKPGPDAGFDEIVAVDGGSTDGTIEFFKEHNIPVIAQSRRGRGEAFLQAFQQLDSDAFIFFSPDGNEDPKDLAKFRPLLQQGAELVIASRMMKGAWNEEDHLTFKWRKWANNAFNVMVNFLFRRSGGYVTDSINGYRALTRQTANRLQLDAPDYTIEYQMTIRALKHKMKIAEFPTHEGDRVAGETGAPSFSTGLKFIGRLWREFTSSSNQVV